MSKNINNLNKSLEDTLDLSNYAPVEHGTHLALGTTSGDAFRGDYGLTAYNHSQATHAPSNAQKNSDITKAEIEAKLTGNITSHTHNYASSSDIGTLSNLQTSNKSNLVGAVNELFQNVDNGKQLIADIIDNNAITKDSGFSAMSEKVSEMKQQIETNKNALSNTLSNKGVSVSSSDSIDDLLVKLERMNIYPHKVKSVACCMFGTLIVKDDGSLWVTGSYTRCFGLNDNSIDTTKGFVQVTTNINYDVEKVFSADSFSFILKKDGTLWGCGVNSSGQLGVGHFNNVDTWTKVTGLDGVRIKDVSLGGSHTAVLSEDRKVYLTGSNDKGQLGLRHFDNVSTFTNVKIGNQMIFQVACGNAHTLLATDSSNSGYYYVYGCGWNYYGQLGIANPTSTTSGEFDLAKKGFCKFKNLQSNANLIAAEGNSSWIKKTGNSGVASGSNGDGILCTSTTGNKSTWTTMSFSEVDSAVRRIIPKGSKLYLLCEDGSLWVKGYNYYGNLGLGHNTTVTTLTKVTASCINADINNIVCGESHTVILKNDYYLYYTGGNNSMCPFGSNKVNAFTFADFI